MHCQTCGRTISSDYQFCPYCGYAVDRFSNPIEASKKVEQTKPSSSSQPFHQTTTTEDDSADKFLSLITVILLFVCFPIGLVFMWITKPFSRSTRWTISLILIIMSILGFALIIFWTSLPGYVM